MELNLRENNNFDIFIYSHVPFRPYVTDHRFKVLTNNHAPSSQFDTDLEIFRDYDGINISNNNLMFNEYSGLYWVWKNYPMKDYIGLNHYRRYYLTDDKTQILQGDLIPNLDEIFKTHKIILNEPFEMRMFKGGEREGELYTNKEWYEFWHNIDDLNLLGEIIKDKYPEYMDGYEEMLNATYIYPSSIFIMPKELFCNYCEFIFGVLNEFRKRRSFFNKEDCIKYVEQHRDAYIKEGQIHAYYDVEKQSRIVGYIAERALMAYLLHGGNDSLEKNAKIFKWAMLSEKFYK